MNRRTIGVLGAAGLLTLAGAVPVAAQNVVEIPAGEPVVIGTFGVLTGPNAPLGIDWLDSVRLAANERGELGGHEILVEAQDGECTPQGGAQAALALVTTPNIVGIIGSACSDETVGGIQSITDAGLTTISPSATRPGFTDPDERGPEMAGFLRTAHSDFVQGPAVADFLLEQGITKVATIHDGSAYASALAQVFGDDFSAKGGTITQAEAINVGDTNMTPVLQSIAVTEPEALYFPIFNAEGAAIVSQVRGIEGMEDVLLIGSDGLYSSVFVEAAGPDVVGMILSSPDLGALAGDYAGMRERYVEFVGNEPPSIFHAHGYDAANIMMNAIESVAVENDDGSLSVDLAALREAVYATENFEGVTGTITCDEFGDCSVPAIGMYEITQEDADNDTPPSTVIWPR